MNINHKLRPRVAFISRFDAQDVRTWSGTLSFMGRALEKHIGTVCYLGPADSLWRLTGAALNRVSSSILRKRFDAVHNILLSKRYAQIFSRRLEASNCDVIFAPGASVEIAWLETQLPIVYMSDLTWDTIVDYYPEFRLLLPMSLRQGEVIESRAIAKARRLVFPSEWAAQSAIDHYHASSADVHVIPFGANLLEVPSAENRVREMQGICRLLWVGVSWERKGGDIALDTLIELERLGIEAELVVCGCVPPKDKCHPRMRVIPFLDKNDPEQRAQLSRLFREADLFLFPTRGDATPIVLCEASAYSLPCITCDTGGVRGAVADGENSILLPFSAGGYEYAKVIACLWNDLPEYRRMAHASRATYEQRLNWDSWGSTMNRIVQDIL